MEKIHAACTMDWSIELEKGLRSKKPGASIKAIRTIGQRLEQWNIESQLSVAAYNMFGMVPEEDRIFANTILLRLTVALSDKSVRLAVLKVFLSEWRHRNKKRTKSKSYNGILANSMVNNPVELLNRVKLVFDTGDVESRALSLIVIGCWADFAKDNGDIRYLILSSLVSSHAFEARASLFAAGCFCELLDDFALVVLEMLVEIMTSPKTLPIVRLAGARIFSKLGCSSSVIDRAYKLGKKLMLESSNDELLVAMLISLSKLASRSILLISEQVEFLFSYLTHKSTIQVQNSSLTCLRNILSMGVSPFLVNAHMMTTLLCLLDESQLSSAMQFDVLWILHKIVLYWLPDLLCMNMVDLSKLLIIIENGSQFLSMESRRLAMGILVNLAGKLGGRTEMESLPSKVIKIIIDQLKQTLLEKEAQYLLKLLICLVEEHTDVSVLVLDNICSLIEGIVTGPTMKSCSHTHENVGSTVKRSMPITSKLIIYVHRFLVSFLDILDESGFFTKEIYQKVSLLIRHVLQCSLYDSYTHTLFSLLLYSYITCELDQNLGFDNLAEYDNITLLYVKKMLSQSDYWSAYKVGLHAACQGSWLIANFIFEELTIKVQSKSCYNHLKFYAKFAHAEKELQFLIRRQSSPNLVNSDLLDYSEKLESAYSSFCSSRDVLEAIDTSGEAFHFQKCFLHLKIKVLENIMEIVRILRNFSMDQDNIIKNVNSVTQISHRLTILALKFDLIVTSFMGMDRKSMQIISSLALSCAVLAFITGFANTSSSMLIENLIARLRHVDYETCKKLRLLLKPNGGSARLSPLLGRNQIMRDGCEIREIIRVCRFSIDGVACLRSNENTMLDEEILLGGIKDGFRLLSEVIKKWIHIPFRTPKRFFRLRPCIGAELFAINGGDLFNPNSISVKPGFQLSLNLCLQIKNVPPNLPIHQTKLYCILHCKPSFQVTTSNQDRTSQSRFHFQDFKNDDDDDLILDLNDKLLQFATKCTKKTIVKDTDIINDGSVNTYLCFEPNEKGQGFSACLFDVSGFCAGSFEIRWLSCCIDNQGVYWRFPSMNAGPIFTVHSMV